MKAVLSSKSGPPEVLKVVEREKPSPGPGEVLVKVHTATVTSGDVKMRRFPRLVLWVVGLFAGFKPMKTSGVEYAGTVEAVGDDVTAFKVGDAVCGTTTGLTYGANAEYVCVPEKPKLGVIVHKPEGVSFDDAAAAIVGPMTAMYFLKGAEVAAGQRVLVYGASGSVGSFAVQLAKHFGAEVTGVASTANQELVQALGADHAVDYTREDFTENGQRYDLIFDAVGKLSKSKCADSLSENGRFVTVRSSTKESAAALEEIQRLVASGELKPVIDREFSLDSIVEAHRYVESGHKKGNVIVRVAGP